MSDSGMVAHCYRDMTMREHSGGKTERTTRKLHSRNPLASTD